MPDREKIVGVLYDVIDTLNRQLPPEQKLEKSTATVLIGDNGSLDSLGLISFIVAVEQKIEENLDGSVVLSDDSLMADENGPFGTIESLADHIAAELEK